MKRVLREEIEKQRKLMNLQEQEPSWSDAIYDYVVTGLKNLFGDDDKPEEEVKKKSSVSDSSFDSILNQIIDKIEGGYYHPVMVQGGRGFPKGDRSMGDSGETLFGIDRKHGGTINDTSEGKRFWEIIDGAGASTKWPWLYRGGNLEGQLKSLARKMIKKNFETLAGRYLSDDARKIVMSDNGLLTHFGYATWNGLGWFRRFAQKINDEVENGVTDPKELLRIGLSQRKSANNRLISSSADKLEQIIGTNFV